MGHIDKQPLLSFRSEITLKNSALSCHAFQKFTPTNHPTWRAGDRSNGVQGEGSSCGSQTLHLVTDGIPAVPRVKEEGKQIILITSLWHMDAVSSGLILNRVHKLLLA